MTVLRARGVRKMWTSGERGLIWLEGEDVRTLVVSRFNNSHAIVRLAIDYEPVVRPRETELTDVLAMPSRRSYGASELTILLDEVDTMLPWAMSYDAGARTSPVNVPSIAGAVAKLPPEIYWPRSWNGAWSARAAEAERHLAPSHHRRQKEKNLQLARNLK